MRVSNHATASTDHVVCLHASLSSSRQWQGLAQRLRHVYRVSAFDLQGYGDAPRGSDAGKHSLDREVAALIDRISALPGAIHLVGHSYGGAVAVRAAQHLGDRVRSLTLYEPVLFAALLSHSPHQPASMEIQRLFSEMRRLADGGDAFGATQRFIDYWCGAGSWKAMCSGRRQRLACKIDVLLDNVDAVARQPNALADLAGIAAPTLYLSGRESTAAINAISNLVRLKLPWATNRQLPGMGHMGPITHGDIVNEHIAAFIQRLSGVAYAQGFAQAA